MKLVIHYKPKASRPGDRTLSCRGCKPMIVPPPPGKPTIKALQSQLQAELLSHSGYIPEKGMLMAFHAQFIDQKGQRGSNETTVRRLEESEW